MKFLCTLLGASALVVGFAASALAADTIVPAKQMATPVAQSFPGRTIDLLGVAPGMTEDEARKVIAEKIPGKPVEAKKMTVGMEYKGIRVRLENFVGELSAINDSDNLRVVLSSPVTGSRAIIISRGTNYKDVTAAPTVNTAIDALKAKYGKPSLERKGDSIVRIEWYLTDKGEYTCPTDKSRNVQYCDYGVAFERNDFDKEQKNAKAGFKMTLGATLYSLANSDRVASINMTLADVTNHMLELNNVDALLKDAVDKGLSGNTTAKPAL